MRFGKWIGGFFVSIGINTATLSLFFLIKLFLFSAAISIAIGFAAPVLIGWIFPDLAKSDALYTEMVDRKKQLALEQKKIEEQSELEFLSLPKEEQDRITEEAKIQLAIRNEERQRQYYEGLVKAEYERIERADKFNKEQQAIQSEKDRIRLEMLNKRD